MNIADLATLLAGHPAGLAMIVAAVFAAARRWLRRIARLAVAAGIAVVLLVLMGWWHAQPEAPKPAEVGRYR